MNLVNYQAELIKQIYELLVNEDGDIHINVYGDSGSGKTTLGLFLADYLKEDWKSFYICGVSPTIGPYLTWHIGTELYETEKIKLHPMLSFGVPSIVHAINIGVPKIEKINYILNPSELAIISEIKNQADSVHNILFIIDDYELWDTPSKELVKKICTPKLKVLSEFRVTILFLSHEKQVEEIGNIPWNFIPINNISDEDILEVIKSKNLSYDSDIKDSLKLIHNNLSLALMLAEYSEKNLESFNDIIDFKIRNLSESDQEMVNAIKPLSIIDNGFATQEVIAFMDDKKTDNTVYYAEQCIQRAESHDFLKGNVKFVFSNERIQRYFQTKIENEKKLLHLKFSKYLNAVHPEDYYSRGKHLKLSVSKLNDANQNEAWQLLFVAYIRLISEYSLVHDEYKILPEIEESLECITDYEEKELQKEIFFCFKEGYQKYINIEYKQALNFFHSIDSRSLCPALKAEYLRIVLLSYLQLANNLFQIKTVANELYELIICDEFTEDEQFCRAALVLLEVYNDRCIDENKSVELRNLVSKKFEHHSRNSVFAELNAIYKRKYSLFYSAEIARKDVERSMLFFRNKKDIKNLYISLCNLGANEMVCCNFDDATRYLNECIELINKNRNINFPSVYKVKNNLAILDYLQNEGTEECQLVVGAKRTLTELETLMGNQGDEVSHVIYLNWLGLSMLCNTNQWENELQSDKYFLDGSDAYYQYFYHDLKFAAFLLNNDVPRASSELSILQNLKVPLLEPYNTIFLKRIKIQTSLLNEPQTFRSNAVKYHLFMKKELLHTQDSSCGFYGRGFLLSDLQFLSF